MIRYEKFFNDGNCFENQFFYKVRVYPVLRLLHLKFRMKNTPYLRAK